jgi:S-methylmethionine-dependent homocysteine/selenocysteine methylase
MAKYRNALPQLADRLFLTDGGIETSLIFQEGLDLPYFAAFNLLKDDSGTAILRKYFNAYVRVARKNGVGFILESATWRASPDWARLMGYSTDELAGFNRKAIAMLEDIRNDNETDTTPMVISGCVGPRGDGYDPQELQTAQQAEEYHQVQIGTFAKTAADMITAITMTHSGEAIGVTRAAQAAGLPVAVAFTVETDGLLPTGQSLADAIAEVDAATGNGPAYYMINCAHPTHFDDAIAAGEHWVSRIRGIRANASTASHAELDEAEELDAGNPKELGAQYRDLKSKMGHVTVVGGCCGTDHRHIEEICLACAA